MSECVQWQNLIGESNFNDSFDSLLRQKSPGKPATLIDDCSRLVRKNCFNDYDFLLNVLPQSVERGITLDLGFSSFQCPLPDQVKDFKADRILEFQLSWSP